jgi:hypothetical protein
LHEALAYPRYGTILRWIMKRIALREGTPTDTSRVHELTDWRALEKVVRLWLDRVPESQRPSSDFSGVFPIASAAPPVRAATRGTRG